MPASIQWVWLSPQLRLPSAFSSMSTWLRHKNVTRLALVILSCAMLRDRLHLLSPSIKACSVLTWVLFALVASLSLVVLDLEVSVVLVLLIR